MSVLKTNYLLLIISLIVFSINKLFAQNDPPPNILIIMTDQQAWDAVGYAGNDQIQTPHLDRLAREGVNFSQAVTPVPVCVPARTSILTGRLAETTTIRENRDAKSNDCQYPTYDEILTKQGYKAEYYGKFHAPAQMTQVYANPSVNGLIIEIFYIKGFPIYQLFLDTQSID